MGAEEALQRAIYERLAGDAALVALIGADKVFDHVPRNMSAPYVHLGEMEVTPVAAGSGAETKLVEIVFSLVAFSRGRGRRETLGLAAALRNLLHDAEFALAGFTLVACRFVQMKTSGAGEVSGRRAVLKFRAVVEEA
ncbi:DUF3168 domain-containing protein [Afifella sp. JA880]|uniref:DUF3168 domain-containing protein n=1 Tax=Afifella sp. JA880 TaxID=2975280 RepID=UPI0021BA6673|nr:DUF3168 domain-containing protein [Afifella sp. JA880]MCT8266769.1 DUF3168 domain-containing protein [Afifella sp. JA880]